MPSRKYSSWKRLMTAITLATLALSGPDTRAQGLQTSLAALPPLPKKPHRANTDWLVRTPATKSQVFRGEDAREIEMNNGLIRRVWRVAPNLATVSYDNLMTRQAILRGVKPEAEVTLNGKPYALGGLLGQPDYAYLKREWVDALAADPQAFRCVGFEVRTPQAPFGWKRKRHAPSADWPPKGVALAFHFEPPDKNLKGLTVSVHYEMYDGIPLLAKWLTVHNKTGKSVRLDAFKSEILAVVERDSHVETPNLWEHPNLHIESDYAFIAVAPETGNRIANWVPDPQHTTQVNYLLQTPNLLECRPPLGPNVALAEGEAFTSFRTYELALDSEERERKSLAVRRMYRLLAPWAFENPLMMHVRSAEPKAVRLAIDQCAEVGFEMAILSFGSGLNMESEDPKYLAEIKSLVDYAHSKGVELGGYSLLASRRISEEDDVINPKTGKTGGAIFGTSPCLESRWGQEYFRKLRNFIEKTGFDLLEHDGSYPGDPCASEKHPGHTGLEDSQWRQWRKIADFYAWCRERGVYLNVPDWYFLTGANKTAMGYREVNWSLPRERQIALARQNIYDGTWRKSPSMGWMFVPLVEYQGGGEAATLEPLHEHLDAYEQHLALNLLAGVQACYRGPRLFDAPETKALVQKWVNLFKKYRAILESDVVHLRRPDGRDFDGLLHVNSALPQKGFLTLFNPLDKPLKTTITLPLYFTGLTQFASLREQEGKPRRYRLNRAYEVHLPVTLPAKGFTWFVIE